MEVNKIYNQDCIEGMKLMEDNSVDVSFTSPPYNRAVNDKYEEYNDNNLNYFDLLVKSTDEALRVTKGYVIINIQQTYYNKKDYFKFLGKYYNKINGIITWEKTNPQPSTNYRKKNNDYSITNAVEVFIFLKNGKEFRCKNRIKNTIKSTVNTYRVKGHGAIMKREVAEYFIHNFTEEGDTVLDYFNGLGTTSVVCKALNRNYIGFEQSKKYYEMSLERIEKEKIDIKDKDSINKRLQGDVVSNQKKKKL